MDKSKLLLLASHAIKEIEDVRMTSPESIDILVEGSLLNLRRAREIAERSPTIAQGILRGCYKSVGLMLLDSVQRPGSKLRVGHGRLESTALALISAAENM